MKLEKNYLHIIKLLNYNVILSYGVLTYANFSWSSTYNGPWSISVWFQWEQKFLEETVFRQLVVDAISMPK